VKPSMWGEKFALLVWCGIAACIFIPVGIATTDPVLASRDGFWIVGGMAGVVALAILLLQPLLAWGGLPGPSRTTTRRWHRLVGTTIVVLVGLHVGALYLSSPQDMIDALMLTAPTPFSVFGVIGLGGVLLTVVLVAMRSRTGLRYASWRIVHNGLALIIVLSSIAHALLIEGAMGPLSKAALCVFMLVATGFVLVRVHFKHWWQ
jgi:predicted ferric reductase